MEYQKIMNLLDNKPNQPSKFRRKICVEGRICVALVGRIRFKTVMLKSIIVMHIYL